MKGLGKDSNTLNPITHVILTSIKYATQAVLLPMFQRVTSCEGDAPHPQIAGGGYVL
jgi:hypothetical protein